MRIGIAPIAAVFVEFFINLSKYLESQGHEVYFLNPDYYEINELVKHNCKIERYPTTTKFITNYNEFSDLIIYLGRLHQIKNIQKLIEHKNRAYSKAFNFFKDNTDYNLILFWNGSGTVEKEICESLYIKSYYFENGYFPQTLQVNQNGVNCDTEFANLSFNEFLRFSFPIKKLSPSFNFQTVSFNQDPIKRFMYRLFDSDFNYMLYEVILHNYRLKAAKSRFTKLKNDIFDLKSIGKYIFFPLQVNSDTQIVLNSKFSSMYEVLDFILPQLKKIGYKIILKEHPFEVEKVDYLRFIDNKNVFLLTKSNIEDLIDNSEFVVCVNSSVGLQAMSRKKPCLILGHSMYDSCPISISYINNLVIKKEIENLKIRENEIESYIHHFKNNIFINGDWKNPTIELLHSIAERILA